MEGFYWGARHNLEKVRPEILLSWERCFGKVDPFQKSCRVILSEKETEDLCEKKKELIDISTSVMESLYKLVEGSGCIIALADENACLVRVIGDRDVVEAVNRINFIKGANWSESVMGTNAVGTCIIAKRPIQIYTYEHWGICVQTGVCSSAPISDPDSGQLMGVLDMTVAECEKAHSHTLGMVVAAVGSIEGQIASKRHWVHSQRDDKYKSLIMESISDGLLTIDNSGVVTQINQKAIDFLGLYANPLGKNIFIFLKTRFGKPENYKDLIFILNSAEDVDGAFITIFGGSKAIKCTITSRCLWEDNLVTGKIIAIQEISKIKRIVNRVVGNRAQTFFSDIVGQSRNFLQCVLTTRS